MVKVAEYTIWVKEPDNKEFTDFDEEFSEKLEELFGDDLIEIQYKDSHEM